MSIETERKIRVWMLTGVSVILLSIAGWSAQRIVNSVDRLEQNGMETKQIVVGFMSKQNEVNDHSDDTHDKFEKEIERLTKKVTSAELEIYKLTGKHLIEDYSRGDTKTGYEKMMESKP